MQPNPPHTGDQPQRYRRRPKRRPAVWVTRNPDEAVTTPPGTSGSEGVARDRTERKARSKRAQGGREGSGEGDREDQRDAEGSEYEMPW